jgi:hypothetical protein
MKICGDDKPCPYQDYFDTLGELEAIDPGLCEHFLSQPDSKCLPLLNKKDVSSIRNSEKE